MNLPPSLYRALPPPAASPPEKRTPRDAPHYLNPPPSRSTKGPGGPYYLPQREGARPSPRPKSSFRTERPGFFFRPVSGRRVAQGGISLGPFHNLPIRPGLYSEERPQTKYLPPFNRATYYLKHRVPADAISVLVRNGETPAGSSAP